MSVEHDAGRRQQDDPGLAFPPGLAKPAPRALHAAGYTRLDQLAGIAETDLAKFHGMGPKAIGLLRDALAASGKSFAEANRG